MIAFTLCQQTHPIVTLYSTYYLHVNVNIIKVSSYPVCDDSLVSASILGDDTIEGGCAARLRSRL